MRKHDRIDGLKEVAELERELKEVKAQRDKYKNRLEVHRKHTIRYTNTAMEVDITVSEVRILSGALGVLHKGLREELVEKIGKVVRCHLHFK